MVLGTRIVSEAAKCIAESEIVDVSKNVSNSIAKSATKVSKALSV